MIPVDKKIVFKASPIHGVGAFATTRLNRGTRVIEYTGEKIDKRESNRRCEIGNECIFYLNEQFDLDGNAEWNPARFINHSCSPNCEAERAEGGIWIVASRDVEAHEEITFNYGYDLQDVRDHPCHCGSPNCLGWIVAEEFFAHVRANCWMDKFEAICKES
jgi:SET domain-containing protein